MTDQVTPLIPTSHEYLRDRYHYSSALLLDDVLIASGQIGVDESGDALPDPEEQFVAAFESVGALLALGGCGFEDVVEVMSFHASFEHFDLFVEVKDRYLTGMPFPTWTAVGAGLAVPGAEVEIKCTALRRGAK